MDEPLDQTGPRLYCVRYAFVAYVWAEDAAEAEFLGRRAWDDSLNIGDVDEVGPGDAVEGDWEDDNFVYHAGGEDLRLDEVWPSPAPVPEPDLQEPLFPAEPAP